MHTLKPRIGGHVSVAGGLKNGIVKAKEIGATTIQFFGSSPRSWSVTQHSQKDIHDFRGAAWEADIGPLFIHAGYLINLASPDEVLRKKSEESLLAELQQANDIGVHGLIFHIGSGKELPRSEALAIVVRALEKILKQIKGDTWLVIENSAGGGQKIGASVEEIGEIIQCIGDTRLKMCFDTAHAFEAGIMEKYTPEAIRKFLHTIERHVSLSRLAALHVNDSKSAFNSHHDRHENLGEGYIGLEAFKNLVNTKELQQAAWLLEVPGFDGKGPDKKNIDILHSLLE